MDEFKFGLDTMTDEYKSQERLFMLSYVSGYVFNQMDDSLAKIEINPCMDKSMKERTEKSLERLFSYQNDIVLGKIPVKEDTLCEILEAFTISSTDISGKAYLDAKRILEDIYRRRENDKNRK